MNTETLYRIERHDGKPLTQRDFNADAYLRDDVNGETASVYVCSTPFPAQPIASGAVDERAEFEKWWKEGFYFKHTNEEFTKKWALDAWQARAALPTAGDSPTPPGVVETLEVCQYCKCSEYAYPEKDFWQCGSKVNAADNYQRSTRCRIAERDALKEALRALPAGDGVCLGCLHEGPFTGITHPDTPEGPAEHDMVCPECGSDNIAEDIRDAAHMLWRKVMTACSPPPAAEPQAVPERDKSSPECGEHSPVYKKLMQAEVLEKIRNSVREMHPEALARELQKHGMEFDNPPPPVAAETGAQTVCHYDVNHNVVKVENAAETATYDDSASKHVKAMQQPLVDALQERFNPPSGPYPFNLARALRGDALVTRDGVEAKNFRERRAGVFLYIADVKGIPNTYTQDGRSNEGGNDHAWDLFLLDPEPPAPPVPEEVYSETWKLCPACNGTGFRPGSGYPDGSDCDVCGGQFQPVIQPKAAVHFVPNQSSRDWTEDFSHENGNYGCLCAVCDQSFNGHKRRHICRECAHPPRDKPPSPDSADGECLTPLVELLAKANQLLEDKENCEKAFSFWDNQFESQFKHTTRGSLHWGREAFKAGAAWAMGRAKL